MSSAKALPVLMYHHVSPAPGLVTLAPATFRAHIEALARAGWRSGGVADVERFLRGESVPKKTCIITFDDGYLDNFIHAHPVLAEFGMKAVLFIVTGWLGDGPVRRDADLPDHRECMRRVRAGTHDSVMLRWSEVEVMRAAATFEFHSHTHTHTRWDRTVTDPETRRAALGEDLQHSRDTLAARLGTVSRHLCWPQGYYDGDYVAVARERGFDHLYTTEIRVNRPSTPSGRIGRFVTKERDGDWLVSRTGLYARPWLGGFYTWVRGL